MMQYGYGEGYCQECGEFVEVYIELEDSNQIFLCTDCFEELMDFIKIGLGEEDEKD